MMNEIVKMYQPLIDLALKHDLNGYAYLDVVAELLLSQSNGNNDIESAMRAAKSNLLYYCENYNVDSKTISYISDFYWIEKDHRGCLKS